MNCREEQMITIAVVGRSAAAYSTLVRAMSGMDFDVKRWAGSAEESGTLCEFHGRRFRLVMLPGTRSLYPRTREESLARDYLVSGKADLILNVVDATSLELDLSLTIRLMELGIPLVMVLNRVDVVEARGGRIDVTALETILESAVVPTATRKKNDPEMLLKKIFSVADNPATKCPRQFRYGDDVECAAGFIEVAIGQDYPVLAKRYPLRWLVYRLMEGDSSVQRELISAKGCMIAEAIHQLRRVYGEDLADHLAAVRDGLVGSIAREVLSKSGAGRPTPATTNEGGGLGRYLTVPFSLLALWPVFSFGIFAPFGT